MVRVKDCSKCCSLQTGVLVAGIIWIIACLLHTIFAIVDLVHEFGYDESFIALMVWFAFLIVASITMIVLSAILLCGLFMCKLKNVKAFFWGGLVYGIIRGIAWIVYIVILAELGGDEILFIRIIVLFIELPWIIYSLILVWSYIKYTEEGRSTGSLVRGQSDISYA